MLLLMLLQFNLAASGYWNEWADWSPCFVTNVTGTQRRERHCIDTVANVSQGQVACDIIELVQNEIEECETDLHLYQIENNVTVIPKICEYAYNRTDLKTCKWECVCENVETDMDCGNLRKTIFCNKREDRDFRVVVYQSYGLVLLIAIATVYSHIKTRLFVKTFQHTQNYLNFHPNSSPTFIAKMITSQWCSEVTKTDVEQPFHENRRGGDLDQFYDNRRDIYDGSPKVDWRRTPRNIQFLDNELL